MSRSERFLLLVAVVALLLAAAITLWPYVRYGLSLYQDCDPLNDWITYLPMGRDHVLEVAGHVCQTVGKDWQPR